MTRQDGSEKDMEALAEIERLAANIWARQASTAFAQPISDDLLDKAMALQEARYRADKSNNDLTPKSNNV